MVREILGAAFGAAIPDALAALLRDDLRAADLVAFEASVIVPFGGAAARLAVADTGDRERWRERVLHAWAHPRLDGFLRLVPPETRRMVDSDGGAEARFFLDDLQAQAHRIRGPHGLTLMCATLHVPSGAARTITRHARPLIPLLPAPIRGAVKDLVARGAGGLWGITWDGDTPVGAVWVSESRWRGDTARTRALVEGLGPPAAWDRVAAVAAGAGLVVYPDALEWTPAGWDVTVGLATA